MKYDFKFVKYQGCGNDFIIKDEIDGSLTPDRCRGRMAKLLCDRHFQIGADGILFLESSKGLDGSMRLFEPDGKEADMCGNGIRCVAAYLCDRLDKSSIRVLTRDGVKHVIRTGDQYRVDMGVVRTRRSDLRQYFSDKGRPHDSLLSIEVDIEGRKIPCALVNTGEPHLVTRSRSVDAENVIAVGEALKSQRSRFPRGVNVNFVERTGPHTVKVRTYERGVYNETLACGTGATASAAVALVKSWVKPGPVKVKVLGGEIVIELDAQGRAFMCGPATKVFSGQLDLEI